ncbi:MAG TPA: GNAT family N-acetyltransferase [Candidatus Binatia bacterium]|jgi:hypothetical protein|nr:GNAT family N-acetyltransferase [Candidatus Binatia bacterium]
MSCGEEMRHICVKVLSPDPQLLTHHERQLIGAWSNRFFGSHPLTARYTWTGIEGVRFRVLAYDGEELVSHLRILERTARVDRKDVLVGGLGAVMTAPERHGKGFAGLTLREAERLIFDELGAEIGFLFCLPELVPFYAKRRWQLIECPVEMLQPAGNVVWPECAMLLPKPGEQWAPTTFDIRGLPF